MLAEGINHVHFVGVGGIGMGALAELLLQRGYRVSGSDCQLNAMTARLQSLGVAIEHGHEPVAIRDADLAVFTSAIPTDNPEYRYAVDTIPCLSRGELLAKCVNQKHLVAVAGTHGKTTTSSLAAFVAECCQGGVSSIVGGTLTGRDSPVCYTDDALCIVESDESDRSFLLLKPQAAIVTNIDHDHLSSYGGEYTNLLDAFVCFLNGMGPEGVAIVNIDDPGVQAILPRLTCKTLTYGLSAAADTRATALESIALSSRFQLAGNGRAEEVVLNLVGRHNVLNALGVCALGRHLGWAGDVVASALARFPGVNRRLCCHGEVSYGTGSVMVIEDYGHHPTELMASFSAVQAAWPNRRLFVVFQPHRYSRTKALLLPFAEALSVVSAVMLLPIYAAGEAHDPDVTSADLGRMMQQHGAAGSVTVIDSGGDWVDSLLPLIQTDDIVLLQGAGDVGLQAASILSRLALEVG